MKVQKIIRVAGEWAKVGVDVRDQDIVTILDSGQLVPGDFGERHVFKIKTESGTEKVMSLNQTSMNNLIDAYGDETEIWKGRHARVHIIRSNVSGSIKNVCYLSHPDWVIDDDGKFVPRDAEGEEVETDIGI